MLETEQNPIQTPDTEVPEQASNRAAIRVVGGTTVAEAVVGAGATVLAILGLVHVLPLFMAIISALAIAAALLVEGTGIAARYRVLRREVAGRRDKAILGGGMTTQIGVGLAGVTLGILALAGVLPWTLLGVAAIIYGSAYIVGSGVEVEAESVAGDGKDRLRRYAHRAVTATAGARMVVGVGAVTLGIIGLAGGASLAVLSLVAMLGLGAVSLVSGSALGTRMIAALRH